MNWRNPFRHDTPQVAPTHEGATYQADDGKWSLDAPLVWLAPNQAWDVRAACRGLSIMGSVGSGKSEGSARVVLDSYLKSGFGGLCLVAKVDMYENLRAACKRTGRLDSLLRFAPNECLPSGEPVAFNFLDYALASGYETENLVSLLMTLAQVSDGGGSQANQGNQQFWNRALKQLLRATIEAVSVAKGRLTLDDLYLAVLTAPTDPKQLQNPDWRAASFLCQCLEQGRAKIARGEVSASMARDFEISATYWENEFCNLYPETRTSITITFSSLCDVLMRGVLSDLLNASHSNVFPDLCDSGAIICLDLPIHSYLQVGLYFQILFKYLWQQYVQRREIDDSTRPLFLFIDEAHYFINNETDPIFFSTSRAAKCCPVLISQGISNYYLSLKSREAAESLMGLLATKIFHSNNCNVTNEYASNLIAKSWITKKSVGGHISPDGHLHRHMSGHEVFEFPVPPREFTVLDTRVAPDEQDTWWLESEAIVCESGRVWQVGGEKASFLKTTFRTELK